MASMLLFPTLAIGLATLVMAVAAAGEGEMKNMVFYMRDNLTGSNETAFPVAGMNGSSSNPGKFGTLVVISDVVTKRPNFNESESDNIVGRAQGMYVNTNPVSGLDFLMVFTLIFHDREYNGSTLEIQGTNRFGQARSEYAVVGGTGKFRFARGYALGATESSSGENAVLEFNTTFSTN